MKKLMLSVLIVVALFAAMTGNANAGNRIEVQAMTVNGSTPTYTGSLAAGTTQYIVRNDGRIFLHFKKTGANACTVGIVTTLTVSGFALADVSVTVGPTTGDVMVGPFPPAVFNDSSGDVTFTVSEATSLSVAVMQL